MKYATAANGPKTGVCGGKIRREIRRPIVPRNTARRMDELELIGMRYPFLARDIYGDTMARQYCMNAASELMYRL